MKFMFLIISLGFSLFNIQDQKCKYESILQFNENEKITFKQVTKLSYYSQASRFAIRRDYHKVELIFSSVYGMEDRQFESFVDRDRVQNYFKKTDFLIRIQFEYSGEKIAIGEHHINTSADDMMKCVVRLYHIDKTKSGVKLISRKYDVKSGKLIIEKLTASSFCGSIQIDIPEYYNLSSKFSLKTYSRD